MVVDPHLDAATELVAVEVVGDRDHRRAVEKGASYAGCEIGGARPERRDAEPGRAGHAAGTSAAKPAEPSCAVSTLLGRHRTGT